MTKEGNSTNCHWTTGLNLRDISGYDILHKLKITRLKMSSETPKVTETQSEEDNLEYRH
jgi:hypothetical protein